MSKICPKCGVELIDSAKFCFKCGCNLKQYEEENQTVFCMECGAKCEKGALFCMECGAKILSNASSQATENFGGSNLSNGDFNNGWGSDNLDGWGDTLKKFNDAEEKDKFIDFKYKKMPNGKIIIEKLIDEYAVKVNVPEGATVIGDGAFENSGVLSVTIPEGVETIGKRAFYNCKNLREVVIPKSVVKIEDEAFAECKELYFEIPSYVAVIGENVMANTKTDILKKQAEAEAKRKAEEEARRKAEEEKRKAEEEARKKAEEEARKKAEIEAKRKAEEEARKKAEEEARKKAEMEAKRKAEEEAKKLSEGKTAEELYQKGVGYHIKGDYTQAFYYYKLAAELGHAKACLQVGELYYYGFGVEKNQDEAIRWLNISISKGEKGEAYWYLGLSYSSKGNQTEAFNCYKKGLEIGGYVGCNSLHLGNCYYFGRGVTQNKAEGRRLWEIAAKAGLSSAKDNLNKYF